MRQLLLSFFLLLFFVAPSAAQNEPDEGPYVSVSTLAENYAPQPGEEIWIGIAQEIYPHWHTYWRNPGDSGSEPRITWDLPDGFEVSELYWPVADKIPYGPLLNYGYSDQAVLLQKLTIPQNYNGAPITLNGQYDILVCKEICVPEFGDIEITLHDGSDSQKDAAAIEQSLAKLPKSIELPTTFSESEGLFELALEHQNHSVFEGADFSNAYFLPVDWGLVANPANANIRIEGNKILISQERGDRDFQEVETLHAVLAFYGANGALQGLEFEASPDMAMTEEAVPDGEMAMEEMAEQDLTLVSALLFALIGGLILNLMPCVFPVLSIKALSLVKIAEKEPAMARAHGIAYTAGIILSLGALAGLLIALKGAGAAVDWGFQLQSPIVIGALIYLLFLIGLNLLGVFEISGRFTSAGQNLTSGHGLKSSFFTGVLATLVATPCTAPFMAGAIGYALVQPSYVALIIFGALGLGLALPYLILSFLPNLQKIMPKPGAWMDVFKQFLAFPMMGATAWLIWVLSVQSGSMGVAIILAGLVIIAFAGWLLHLSHKAPDNAPVRKAIAVILLLGSLLLLPALTMDKSGAMPTSEDTLSKTYSPALLNEALSGDDPVFVEMTAAWCITCKVNHITSLGIESTQEFFKDNKITYIVGDWTNKSDEIKKYLNDFGRSGVPIYVFYGPRKENGERPEPILLPQILTPSLVRESIEPNL